MENISSLYLRIIVHYDGEYYFIIQEIITEKISSL